MSITKSVTAGLVCAIALVGSSAKAATIRYDFTGTVGNSTSTGIPIAPFFSSYGAVTGYILVDGSVPDAEPAADTSNRYDSIRDIQATGLLRTFDPSGFDIAQVGDDCCVSPPIDVLALSGTISGTETFRYFHLQLLAPIASWASDALPLGNLPAGAALTFEAQVYSNGALVGRRVDTVQVTSLTGTVVQNSVPEPMTMVLLGMGLIGCIARRKAA